MTQQTKPTTEQMWRELCLANRPCTNPAGRTAYCPDCEETDGMVWLLPGLQRECRCVCHTVVNKIGQHGIQCLKGCSRWLPVEPHLETLLEALMRLEPPLHLEVRPSAGSYAWLGDVAKHTPEGLEGVACEGADTPLEAGVRAAHKALGLEKKEESDA